MPDVNVHAEPIGLLHVFCPLDVTWTEQATFVGDPQAQLQVAGAACSPS